MQKIEKAITVRFHHQVLFTDGVFNPLNPVLRDVAAAEASPENRKVLVVIEDGLTKAQPDLERHIVQYFETGPSSLQLVCPPLVREGGERVKNSYFHVSEIHSPIDRYGIDRHSYIIGVGGGALLDMVGLAAATAHRGIRHIRIPSTTLAQNDSGVGVKNGINAFGKKNFIGTFAPPYAVINDFELLRSLPDRDKRAGYAEAVKVGCIRDKAFFAELEKTAGKLASFDPAAMRRLIFRCAELHVEHIATSGDPFEMGSARPLDFGHWSAHKLEQLSDYRLRHGEAVAIGIAIDTMYSRSMGWLDRGSAERVIRLLENLGFGLCAPELQHRNSEGSLLLLEGLNEFREHLGGRLTLTMLKGIGTGFEVHEVDEPVMVRALRELEERGNTGAAMARTAT